MYNIRLIAHTKSVTNVTTNSFKEGILCLVVIPERSPERVATAALIAAPISI